MVSRWITKAGSIPASRSGYGVNVSIYSTLWLRCVMRKRAPRSDWRFFMYHQTLPKLLKLLIAALLSLGLLSPAQAGEKRPADDNEKRQTDLEARLDAARERLEAAAREVAELSGDLSSPI